MSPLRSLLVLTLIYGLSSYAWCQEPEQARVIHLTIPSPEANAPDRHDDYYERMLMLALKKSAAPGEEFVFTYSDHAGKERLRAALKAGVGIDVIWSSTNREREANLQAIPINLFKGVNEYRLLMIRAGEEHRFAHIKTVEDLRRFRAGSGSHWQDTAILKANDLPYVTSWHYAPMFRMLAAKRFDYMSRGANEVWSELEANADLKLTLAPDLMLHYPLAIYFFVSKKNKPLAIRIENGLKIAQEDGSFDELFFSIPGHKRAWDEIQQHNKRVIELQSAD